MPTINDIEKLLEQQQRQVIETLRTEIALNRELLLKLTREQNKPNINSNYLPLSNEGLPYVSPPNHQPIFSFEPVSIESNPSEVQLFASLPSHNYETIDDATALITNHDLQNSVALPVEISPDFNMEMDTMDT